MKSSRTAVAVRKLTQVRHPYLQLVPQVVGQEAVGTYVPVKVCTVEVLVALMATHCGAAPTLLASRPSAPSARRRAIRLGSAGEGF